MKPKRVLKNFETKGNETNLDRKTGKRAKNEHKEKEPETTTICSIIRYP